MKNKLSFWVITSVLSIFVIYALINTVLIPALSKNPLPKATVQIKDEKGKTGKVENINPKDDTIPDSLVSHNSKDAKMKLFELRKREVLLHSRLTLANEDSMYLVLDLINNIAILEMKGVSLHECRIIDSNISNSIKMYQTETLLNWMAEPFTVKHVEATIPKIVFIEKIAPKDTIEANKVQVEPAMPKLGDVYIVMDFDRNLRLVISQTEKPDAEGKKLISDLRWKYQRIEIKRTLQSFIKFNREPAMPQIDIVLPKSDATILYKALPLNPKMILRM
ncbi:MAG: hypothetical protein NTY07_12860 [Bacteroidia bacterium]|nr:hypothetical protein [Bacteroidia bacterium]